MPGEFIGNCPAISRLRKMLPLLAESSHPLVLVGEPGTGKSLYAAHLHARSPLNKSELLRLNFSFLSERDQRLGIFGSEPPELTSTKRSILEYPTTVILKHIDHAAHYLQDKLAESLARGKVQRFGASEYQPVRARLIFSFRNSFSSLQQKGRLSSSLSDLLTSDLCNHTKALYFPPLHKRGNDPVLLSQYFSRKFQGKEEGSSRAFTHGFDKDGIVNAELAELLRRERWPDNIRDLTTFIRSITFVSLSDERRQHEKHQILKLILMLEAGEEFSLPDALATVESGILRRANNLLGGRQSKVAALLGLSDRDVRRKLS